MMRLSFLSVFAALAACAHDRPAFDEACAFPAYQLSVDLKRPPSASNVSSLPQETPEKPVSPFYAAMEKALEERRRQKERAEATEVAALSGGSQHGAFGAGYLLGLNERGAIPEYDVVTGVSTGALQSTYLFLAKEPPPADRIYPADIGYSQQGSAVGTPGEPARIPLNSGWLEDLAIGYSIREEKSVLRKRGSLFGPEFAAVTKGAAATLQPLEERIKVFLTDRTFEQIRDAKKDGRALYIGVSNLDDGEAYAIDLTALVTRALDENWDAERLRGCYARSLLASASVPFGAPPVMLSLNVIDPKEDSSRRINGLFIDGGAKFAVFLEDMLALKSAPDAGPVNITTIINGFLFPGEWRDSDGQSVERWSILNVGFRSIGILQNQVTQFSAKGVLDAERQSGEARLAFIGRPKSDSTNPLDFVVGGKSCTHWREEDAAEQKPFEFYPRYMRCILEYGRSRGRDADWNEVLKM
jgi:predicted acylesterase/phospholipase RssA